MTPPLSGRGSDVPSPAPHARLLGLCARIAAIQQRTEALALEERRAERRNDLAAAGRLHHRGVRLVHLRHRLLERLCDLPAPTALTRQAKIGALDTLITFDSDGRPDRLNGLALWSVLHDLEAAGPGPGAGDEVITPGLRRALLRRVWRIGADWHLSNDEVRRLLVDLDEATFQAWRRPEALPLPPGMRRRLGLLLAIDHALRRRSPSAERRLDLMTRPHPGLGGRTPLARLLDGRLDDLVAVHALLAEGREHRGAGRDGDRLAPAPAPIEAVLRRALTRFCDGEEGPPPPAPAFPSWEALLRWVWDGDGEEDTAVRGHLAPLAAATTPGGLHRALGLLRDVEAFRRRLRDAGTSPDDPDGDA